MSYGVPKPKNCVGKKGKSGRKKLSEEYFKEVKARTYKEILAELLPDTLLAEKHLELLTVPKKTRTYVKGDLSEEIVELDTNAVKAGLDMAYKLKGEYSPEKIVHSGEIKQVHSEDIKNKKEILDLTAEYEEKLRKQILE